MGQESDDKDSKKKIAPSWLKEGFLDSFSDSIKTFLIPVITFLIIGLLSFLFYINQVYINISFSIPAYRWALALLISIFVVYWNKTRIDNWLFRLKIHPAEGFLWKINKRNQVVGPLCPKCKSFVVESADKKGNAFGMLDGAKKNFNYSCSNPKCSFKHHLEIKLEDVIQKAQAELIK